MINVQLKNNTQPLTDGAFDAVQLNQSDQYDKERMSCEKLRISANVGVICDGSLMNPTTEIINGQSMSFGPYVSENNEWFTDKGISNIKLGLDIFNCEFLRNKYPVLMKSDDFTKNETYTYFGDNAMPVKVAGAASDMGGSSVPANTTTTSYADSIYDIVSQYWSFLDKSFSDVVDALSNLGHAQNTTATGSESFKDPCNTITGYETTGMPSKYNEQTYLSYYDALNTKLIKRNGYFGFYNPISFKVFRVNWSLYKYEWDHDSFDYGYGHVSGARPGEFIEMYPSGKEYSYVPIYNKDKLRTEYNWLTYLTYPKEKTQLSGYTTNNGSLIATFIDDTDGETIMFHTPLKHGLTPGDVVNVYSTHTVTDGDNQGTTLTEIEFSNVEVVTSENPYDFTISSPQKLFEWEYAEVTGQTEFSPTDEIVKKYVISGDVCSVVLSHAGVDTNNIFMSHGQYSRSISQGAKTYSIKKVENGMECEYYFRKFKSLPVRPSIVKNSFAIDTFGVSRANVLLDDVDITGLESNLECPITDLYLTSIKNNKGYYKWYGYDTNKQNTGDETIEISHCFGPVNGGFVTNAYNRKFESFDIRYIERDEGLSVLSELPNAKNEVLEDGSYEGIGDFCIFSPTIFKETSLQMFMHRFNTAQRDVRSTDAVADKINIPVSTLSYKSKFTKEDNPKPKYFNVLYDPDSKTGLHSGNYGVKTDILQVINNPSVKGSLTNGYYYQPHSKIRIRTFSSGLSYESAINYRVVTVTSAETMTYTYGNIKEDATIYVFTTNEPNDFRLNGKADLYFVMPNTTYHQPSPFEGVIKVRYTDSEVAFELSDDSRKTELDELIEMCNGSGETPTVYLCRRPDIIPTYAKFINDGSLRYVWRDVIQNGFDDATAYEKYPFTNGALYIEPTINIYLRRQRTTTSNLSQGGTDIKDIISYPPSETMDTIKNKPSSYETALDKKELETC